MNRLYRDVEVSLHGMIIAWLKIDSLVSWKILIRVVMSNQTMRVTVAISIYKKIGKLLETIFSLAIVLMILQI